MELKKFDFEFKHAGKKFNASCEVSQPGNLNYPRYRVYVPGGKWGDVYIFYLIDDEERLYFTYKVNSTKDMIADSIKKALENFKETKANTIVIKNYKPFWAK